MVLLLSYLMTKDERNKIGNKIKTVFEIPLSLNKTKFFNTKSYVIQKIINDKIGLINGKCFIDLLM